jgi:hypothetical protein
MKRRRLAFNTNTGSLPLASSCWASNASGDLTSRHCFPRSYRMKSYIQALTTISSGKLSIFKLLVARPTDYPQL